MSKSFTGVLLIALYLILLALAFGAPRVYVAAESTTTVTRTVERVDGDERPRIVSTTTTTITAEGECLSLQRVDDATASLHLAVPDATLFQDALFDTELDGDLAKLPMPITAFVPTNEAFLDATVKFLEENGVADNQDEGFFQQNVAMLTRLLMFHVAQGMHSASDLVDGKELSTIDNNEPLIIERDEDGAAWVAFPGGTARVVEADVPICNGFVHLIDRVLVPPEFLSGIVPAGPNTNLQAGGRRRVQGVAEGVPDSSLFARSSGMLTDQRQKMRKLAEDQASQIDSVHGPWLVLFDGGAYQVVVNAQDLELHPEYVDRPMWWGLGGRKRNAQI